ncbi:hypothetical protein [Paenibacillus roseipurpureus]|uniref:Uncharacterized protein n=1 Tax=Paenibacillus roseopurpureus TaxID=2918901 RepID=A0AA96LPB8_9BACL|nr:hypothetical protein [Paenibacillus sp. MBLB1832]WNR44744.1 hypothetical protein MJB10_00855 [Paenibacillus sp. MBLB1832]
MTNTHDSNLSKQSTIYSYTLIKRIYHSLYKIVLYYLVLALLVFSQFEASDWLPLLVSYPLVLIFQTLLIRAYFHFTIGMAMRGWSYRWGIFWSGFLPEGNASVRLVTKVQLHLFAIGLALILILYPWIPQNWLIYLMIFHCWMVFPRLWMMFRFYPYRKSGLVKISSQETSCYLQ